MSKLSAAMNCERLKVAFAGTPEFAAMALDALIASEHEVLVVLTQPDRPAGRGRKLVPSAVKQRALAAGIALQQPVSLRDEAAQAELASVGADVLVVAAYGLILPQAVLDMPRMGCLNIHGSLLPRWRGAAPIHRAILAGDTQTGVCIMQMNAGLDTGDVLLERRLDIGENETSAQLHDRLAALGASALMETLAAHCRGELQAVVQVEEGVSYAEKLSKAEAQLDFSAQSSEIHRRIRAFNPWPVAEASLQGERVRVWLSRQVPVGEISEAALSGLAPGTLVDILPDALRVRTGDGLIDLLQLQWPGKKMQDAKVFCQRRELRGEAFSLL